MTLSLDACWSPVCTVDTSSLEHWLQHAGPGLFPALRDQAKPQRVFQLPRDALQPIVDTVLGCFPCPAYAYEPMLSRMQPGQKHGMHVDHTPAGWVTRIHVPLATNPKAWLHFEEEDRPVHFGAGVAYTFDMRRRHSFGNDGTTDRVHLIFEVMAPHCGAGAISATGKG